MRSLIDGFIRRALDTLRPRRKAMRALRAQWGAPGTRRARLAADYFERVRDSAATVDDKTWVDLEFPAIFASLDTAVTPPGSQVLYRQLRTRAADAAGLAARHALHTRLLADAALRGRLQWRLLPLQDDAHARIAEFLFGGLPPPPAWRAWLPVLCIASIVVLVATFALGWPFWPWLALVVVNAIVIFQLGGTVQRDIDTLSGCLQLVRVANDLAELRDDYPFVSQLAGLARERDQRAAFRRGLRWLAFLQAPLVAVVARVLNFAFLLEAIAHVRAMASFARLRRNLAASFALVGGIDAAIAVASWLACHPAHCRPVIAGRPLLHIRDGCHPLLDRGVPNSVRLDGRSALVTGSNMAGKTTFIKLLGVNVILGQTLGFCLAAEATIPRAAVLASIQAAHSVAAGKSHYFSEVETIRACLARSAGGGCTIFVIDELFSGTNTIERVAIARAVLEALAHASLVLATTHDVELQAQLQDRFDLFHFQEDPAVAGFFDYRLRPGPALARNAIRLLGEIGFPPAIVAAALAYARQAPALARDERDTAALHCGLYAKRAAAMPRQTVHSDSAPKAIGPYSQAVRAGNTLYLSGQTPLDPATGEMVAGGIEAQAQRVFENLKAVLAAAGASFDEVVRVAIYMTDLANFGAVNEVMKQHFREPYPARSTIGVAALPRGAAVEIDVIAVTGH